MPGYFIVPSNGSDFYIVRYFCKYFSSLDDLISAYKQLIVKPGRVQRTGNQLISPILEILIAFNEAKAYCPWVREKIESC